MKAFSFDWETWPIRPGRQAPSGVAAGLAVPGEAPRILLRDKALDELETRLERGETWINHTTAFDAAVTVATRARLFELILDAYERNQIVCVSVREQLIRIAQGTSGRYHGHGLVDLLGRHKLPIGYKLDEHGKKAEAWRTQFWRLDGVAPEAWPEDPREYLLRDADAPLRVYEAQERYPATWLVDQYAQSRADFLLYLVTCWGCRVDQRARTQLAEYLEGEIAKHRAILVRHGLVRDKDGTRDTAAAHARVLRLCADLKIEVPRTEKGNVSTEKDGLAGIPDATCKECHRSLGRKLVCDQHPDAGTYDVLQALVGYSSASKTRNRLERLRRAGDLPIQVRYEVLKDTGRTSAKMGKKKIAQEVTAWGDAQQNLDRNPGLRECYIARPDHLLWSCDYTAGELHTLGQCLIWLGLKSKLADLLNSGIDVHTSFACEVNGWDYKWAQEARKGLHGEEALEKVDKARQGSKAADFGFPGGLGADKFRIYAWKNYRVRLVHTDERDEAAELREAWLAMFPEMREYFRIIDRLVKSKNPQKFFVSNRLRGDVYFANACNGWFQGLLADMAKRAGWLILRAGLRPWSFQHDEWIGESPIARASADAKLASALMEQAGREYCPDCPPKAPPAVMRRWRKGADPVWHSEALIPWEDRVLRPAEVEKARKLHERGYPSYRIGWEVGIEEERVQELLAA